MSIGILLADDHRLVRAGFRALLQELAYVEVLAEAADGNEALRLARQHQPDVILMDIGMRGLNGVDATARVARQQPDVKVLMLSMHADEEYVLQALRAGASGYLLKDADSAELEFALKSVVHGETYLSPAISRTVIQAYLDKGPDNAHDAAELTTRQREILQLIAEGHSTRAIAERLNLSIKTVETHRSQLMQRLGIFDVPGLVRYAVRTRLVDPSN